MQRRWTRQEKAFVNADLIDDEYCDTDWLLFMSNLVAAFCECASGNNWFSADSALEKILPKEKYSRISQENIKK